ncbi:restriction endonuclease [Micromonospora sp. DT4]|uniref:restriction endonuclease n=1 Tax=Micromonospora sp. DT4 TaxID=3393438 RepID=UPI003CEC582B
MKSSDSSGVPFRKGRQIVRRTFEHKNRSEAEPESNSFRSLASSSGAVYPFGVTKKLYSNPDGDPRGPWRKVDLTAPVSRPHLTYPIFGYRPPSGRSWRYNEENMRALVQEGLILRSPQGRPFLKRLYTQVLAKALEDLTTTDYAQSLPIDRWAGNRVEIIVREAMCSLARQVALRPGELVNIEWRDLERLMREVFEEIGFETQLTRPAKDGGFDLKLLSKLGGEEFSCLVEIKHWRTSRPGKKTYTEFVEVVVREGTTQGLLLSTSGFRDSALSGRLAVEHHPVRLGTANKVVELCQVFLSKKSGLIEQELFLPRLLLDDTH